jgi:membrane-bound metal-dependent hydrolase YbcI (DUF457 family)
VTTFEHAMLGINGALAVGLHRRFGWQTVAMSGFAAVSPDWDGLTIIVGPIAFAEGHRVWGHNLLACVLLGILIGSLDYQFDLVSRAGKLLTKLLRLRTSPDELTPRVERTACGQLVWILVAIVAALSQLPADMLVSGSKTLPDWELKLLWPFSDQDFVYPMVSWGDVGITLIFISGMFAMIKWNTRLQPIAAITLLSVAAYIVIRGTVAS